MVSATEMALSLPSLPTSSLGGMGNGEGTFQRLLAAGQVSYLLCPPDFLFSLQFLLLLCIKRRWVHLRAERMGPSSLSKGCSEPWDLGNGAPGSWLSLHCNEL